MRALKQSLAALATQSSQPLGSNLVQVLGRAA